MNRTDRLFAILLEIQSHPAVTSHTLARQFDITKRTVYRDVRALIDAGVPVIGKAGEGYSIAEGYFLPAVRFTREEAMMLILGAESIGQHFESSYKKAAHSAERKIHSILPAEIKREIIDIRQFLRFYASSQLKKKESLHAMLNIRRAILEKKQVAFRYFKRYGADTEPTVRTLDPYAITNINGTWLVSGYDHLRRDLRMFRLSRMESVMVTKKTFVRPKRFSLKQLEKEERSAVVRYTVKLDRDTERWVEEQPPYKIVSKKRTAASLILHIDSAKEEEILSWILRWGTKAEVLSPEPFRQRFREILKGMSEKYR